MTTKLSSYHLASEGSFDTLSTDSLWEMRALVEAYAEDPNGAVLDGWEPREGTIITEVRAISARINQNFDAWPSEELKAAHHTFVGKPVFVNHNNHDPSRARGRVVASRYVDAGENDRYIQVLQEVEASRFPLLAKELMEGGLDSVSMGAEAREVECSYCGNISTSPFDACEHIPLKGATLQRRTASGTPEDVLIYEICRKISFFELSYVFDPADETAVASNVLVASRKTADWDGDVASAVASGGFTFRDTPGDGPTSGYMVSVDPQAELILPTSQVTPEVVREFIDQFGGILSDSSKYVGGWDDGGTFYLDISTHVQDQEEAEELARANNQLAIWDIGAGQEVRIQDTRQALNDIEVPPKVDTLHPDEDEKSSDDWHEYVDNPNVIDTIDVLDEPDLGLNQQLERPDDELPEGFEEFEDIDEQIEENERAEEELAQDSRERAQEKADEEAAAAQEQFEQQQVPAEGEAPKDPEDEENWDEEEDATGSTHRFKGGSLEIMVANDFGSVNMWVEKDGSLIASDTYPTVNEAKAAAIAVARQHRAEWAGYSDFEDCKQQNSDKEDPDAYCGEIKHRVEKGRESKMSRNIRRTAKPIGDPKFEVGDTVTQIDANETESGKGTVDDMRQENGGWTYDVIWEDGSTTSVGQAALKAKTARRKQAVWEAGDRVEHVYDEVKGTVVVTNPDNGEVTVEWDDGEESTEDRDRLRAARRQRTTARRKTAALLDGWDTSFNNASATFQERDFQLWVATDDYDDGTENWQMGEWSVYDSTFSEVASGHENSPLSAAYAAIIAAEEEGFDTGSVPEPKTYASRRKQANDYEEIADRAADDFERETGMDPYTNPSFITQYLPAWASAKVPNIAFDPALYEELEMEANMLGYGYTVESRRHNGSTRTSRTKNRDTSRRSNRMAPQRRRRTAGENKQTPLLEETGIAQTPAEEPVALPEEGDSVPNHSESDRVKAAREALHREIALDRARQRRAKAVGEKLSGDSVEREDLFQDYPATTMTARVRNRFAAWIQSSYGCDLRQASSLGELRTWARNFSREADIELPLIHSAIKKDIVALRTAAEDDDAEDKAVEEFKEDSGDADSKGEENYEEDHGDAEEASDDDDDKKEAARQAIARARRRRQAQQAAQRGRRTKTTRRRKTADDKLDVAAPGDRVNVEKPTSGTTDAEAEESQFDRDDFDNNSGKGLENPDKTPASGIPGGPSVNDLKRSSARASGLQAVKLAEAMIKVGLIEDSSEAKFRAAAEYEKMSRGQVLDRTALLEQVAKVQTSRRSSATKSAGNRGTSLTSAVPPNMSGASRPAAPQRREAATDNDSDLFF